MTHTSTRWLGFIAILTPICCLLVDYLRSPAEEETWLLRWSRTAADHPLRTGVAVFLLGLGLGVPRRKEANLP